MSAKWAVWKHKCRNDYRDGCQPVWKATPPGDTWWGSYEFSSWREAFAYAVSRAVGVQEEPK